MQGQLQAAGNNRIFIDILNEKQQFSADESLVQVPKNTSFCS